jgi:hypothetical protein
MARLCTLISLIFFNFFSAQAFAEHSLKVGDRIEYSRYNDRRSSGTLTSVNGDALSVIEDGSGDTFYFVISPAYAESYNVKLLSGGAAKSNPAHVYVPSRKPLACPDARPKQGDVPNQKLLRHLVVCWFEDTSIGTLSSGKTINIDVLDFKVGSAYRAGNTLMYVDSKAKITPVRIKLNERTYNYADVTNRQGAVYDFSVYVDYNNKWVVAPKIIKMGDYVRVPKP